MKVLIAVEGSEGDCRPVLAVGRRLAEIGHDVEACVPSDYVEYFAARGIKAFAMGIASREFFLAHAHSIFDRNVSLYRTFARILPDYLERQFGSLLAHARTADVMLCSGFVFAASSIAELLQKPMVHPVFAPVYLCSAHVPPPGVPSCHLPLAINRFLWGGLRVVLDRLARPPLQRQRAKLGLEPLGSVVDHLFQHVVFSMDPEIFPLPADLVGRVPRQTSHPYLSGEERMPAAVDRFLAAGPPPVFIGFGSMYDPDGEQRMTMVRDAVRMVRCRAILCGAWATGMPRAPRDPDLLLVGHLPHPALFPRVSLVVHHGGPGTMYYAARAGVPQIMVPHFLDQYCMAATSARLGLGPEGIRLRDLTATRLGRAIRATVDNPIYRRNALVLRERIQRNDGAQELADLVIARARSAEG